MSDDDLVTVATFSTPHEAHIARNALDAAGIRAVVTDGETVAMDWLLSNAIGGVKVQCRRMDAERAAKLIDEHCQSTLEERQFVFGAHRTRNVDEEHQVASRATVARDFFSLECHSQQLVTGAPRTSRQLHIDRKRSAILRLLIFVLEIVDHLFDPHGGWRRQLPGRQE